MKRYAAAYLRRSSATADSPGDASREAQEAAVRRLCGEDVTVYVDWGISGSGAKTEKRVDYQRLRADIVAGKVASVCAYSLSRLGRNARELLDFIELATKHDVPVRTAVESIDTSTAMGRAMLTVMAAFAQLEVESGVERSAAAREARRARHASAGLPVPASQPIYGRKHVTVDGITRVVRDDERPIEPVLDAYREAGTIRGACELLVRRGIPAPRGGKAWGVSTLRRILDAHIPDELPAPNPRGLRRPTKSAALFAGLIRCHCGRSMTPNVARGQYYCAAGRDMGSALHGKMSVTEAALLPVLKAEAARYMPDAIVSLKSPDAERRATLEARRSALLDLVETFGVDEIKRRAAAIDAELATLSAQTDAIARITVPGPVDFDGPVGEANAQLRSIWSAVRLDEAMHVAEIDWRLPERFYDAAVAEAHEAAVVA